MWIRNKYVQNESTMNLCHSQSVNGAAASMFIHWNVYCIVFMSDIARHVFYFHHNNLLSVQWTRFLGRCFGSHCTATKLQLYSLLSGNLKCQRNKTQNLNFRVFFFSFFFVVLWPKFFRLVNWILLHFEVFFFSFCTFKKFTCEDIFHFHFVDH